MHQCVFCDGTRIGIAHIGWRGLALGLAGYLLESLLGRAWFVSLFFVGAIGGSLMGIVVNPSNMVSVGASGAVMGLLAAALVAAMRFPPGATRTQIQAATPVSDSISHSTGHSSPRWSPSQLSWDLPKHHAPGSRSRGAIDTSSRERPHDFRSGANTR